MVEPAPMTGFATATPTVLNLRHGTCPVQTSRLAREALTESGVRELESEMEVILACRSRADSEISIEMEV